jgi:hypothetical protein
LLLWAFELMVLSCSRMIAFDQLCWFTDWNLERMQLLEGLRTPLLALAQALHHLHVQYVKRRPLLHLRLNRSCDVVSSRYLHPSLHSLESLAKAKEWTTESATRSA